MIIVCPKCKKQILIKSDDFWKLTACAECGHLFTDNEKRAWQKLRIKKEQPAIINVLHICAILVFVLGGIGSLLAAIGLGEVADTFTYDYGYYDYNMDMEFSWAVFLCVFLGSAISCAFFGVFLLALRQIILLLYENKSEMNNLRFEIHLRK